MPSTPASTRSNIIPCLRYRDAPAAVEWLCQSFGFSKGAIYPGEHDTIVHAELRFGNGMIMLGSASRTNEPYSQLLKHPDELDGVATQTIYVVVQDADALYQQAQAQGARIVIDIRDEDYGGRGFTCRDLEGHIWTFGTYDPYASAA